MPSTALAPVTHPSIERLARELREVEMNVLTEGVTLASLIREGSGVTEQKIGGWVEGETACALGAAFIAAKAHGIA